MSQPLHPDKRVIVTMKYSSKAVQDYMREHFQWNDAQFTLVTTQRETHDTHVWNLPTITHEELKQHLLAMNTLEQEHAKCPIGETLNPVHEAAPAKTPATFNENEV